MSFNTAVSALMEATNVLYKLKANEGYKANNWQTTLECVIKLLAPFAPHISEELWLSLGHQDSVHTSTWPDWDEEIAKSDTVTLAVQINGKLRGQVELEADAVEESAKAAAQEVAATHLSDKKIIKVIYVKNRIINFVTEN